MTRSPDVSIVVSPRDRFGVAAESLASLLETADVPYELVYVDGNFPAALSAHVATQAKRHGFRHIRLNRYLTPNEARNIGARATRGQLIVFVDNDVLFAPGWLSRLVRTARETGAEVVAPLTCQGLPAHQEIHQAGGVFTHDLPGFFQTAPGERILVEEIAMQYEPRAVAPDLPFDTQLCEFHCALVRRDALERQGWLDEAMLATKEHIDFCIGIHANGGRVLVEPRSVVTFVYPSKASPMTLADWPYFLVRWSETRQRRSVERLVEKWGLKPDQDYVDGRMRRTRWRYDEALVKPIMRKIPLPAGAEGLRRQTRRVISKAISLCGAALTIEADDRMQAAREEARRQAAHH